MIQQVEDGVVIAEYATPTEASKASGAKATNITKVCKGIRRQAGGYEWKYSEDTPTLFPPTIESHGDYKQLRETTYKRNIEEGTLEINTYYDHPPTPEEVIRDHNVDLEKWKLNGYWSKGKDKGWLVSANFLEIFGRGGDLKPDDIVKLYLEKCKNTIKRSTISPRYTTPKVLRLIIADTHIGMDVNVNNEEMFGGCWDAKELETRRNVLVSVAKEYHAIYGDFDEVHIIELGDFLDGWDGFTARKGHALPQNMNNAEAFATGMHFKTELVRDIVENIPCNKIRCFNVTNDNHSSDFGRILNMAVKQIVEAKFANVEYNILARFIEHYEYGKNVFILCHGKDDKHLKFGFKANVDERGKEKIAEYLREYEINPKKQQITFEKGDSHIQVLDNSVPYFNFHSYMAFSPPSGWVKNNYNNSRSGFNVMVADKHSKRMVIEPYYF